VDNQPFFHSSDEFYEARRSINRRSTHHQWEISFMRRDNQLTSLNNRTSRVEWIDISVPIRTAMVHYPGTPTVTIQRINQINSGDPANESRISMGAHTGTHVDAPIHFLTGGDGIDQMPLSATIGQTTVIGHSNS
jgi:hypothetical protein